MNYNFIDDSSKDTDNESYKSVSAGAEEKDKCSQDDILEHNKALFHRLIKDYVALGGVSGSVTTLNLLLRTFVSLEEHKALTVDCLHEVICESTRIVDFFVQLQQAYYRGCLRYYQQKAEEKCTS